MHVELHRSKLLSYVGDVATASTLPAIKGLEVTSVIFWPQGPVVPVVRQPVAL